MQNFHDQLSPNPARALRIQANAEAAATASHSSEQRLTQSIALVNRLLNEQSHRPDAVRLLRQILRERAISQAIKNWDENNLSG